MSPMTPDFFRSGRFSQASVPKNLGRRRLSFLPVAAIVFFLVAPSGCFVTKEYPAFPPAATSPPAEQEVLQPGDVVTVKFPFHPELDVEQPIRRDGNISLQLVGELNAVGRTPNELRAELVELYSGKLKKFEVTVLIRTFRQPRIYVGGEVDNPGVIYMEDRLNVLTAIINAGGFRKSAVTSNVVLIRHREGKRYVTSLDLKESMSNPESEVVMLEPFDVVYVPRTAIDRVGQWVDQYINNIIPEAVGIGFNFEMLTVRTREE